MGEHGLNARILHTRAPFVHDRRPPLLNAGILWNHIRRIQARELRLIRRRLDHPPKEATLRIWLVAANIQRPLRRVQPLDHIQARLVHRALGLLRVLECHANLVAQLGALILPQLLMRLGEVILQQVEKAVVVPSRYAGVVEDQCAVGDEGVGRLGAFFADAG